MAWSGHLLMRHHGKRNVGGRVDEVLLVTEVFVQVQQRDDDSFAKTRFRNHFTLPSEVVFTARCHAERGIAMASCLSVRLCVCDVEVSWSYRLESWKVIPRLISLTFPLSVECGPQHTDLLRRKHPQIGIGIGVGVRNWKNWLRAYIDLVM